MLIYIDNDYKCHTSDDGTMRGFDVPFFDDKCPELIEGYRYIPDGETWVRSDGETFYGEMIAPWKDFTVLDEIQREYERQLLAKARADLADADAALGELGVEWEGE